MELEHIVEALIFASPDGVTARELARVIASAAASVKVQQTETLEEGQSEEPVLDESQKMLLEHAEVTEEQVDEAVRNLIRGYEQDHRAFTLVERPTGWRIAARPDYAPWVRQLFPEKKPTRLTPSALETLAIVAYRQPVTKSSIEAVRGVSVDGPMQTLLDRNIIRIAGRADLPGRPLLYETTDVFLEYIGIKSVDDLPNAAELRAVKLPEPEEAASADPGASQPELPLEGEIKSPKSRKRKGKKGEQTEPIAAPADTQNAEAAPAGKAAALTESSAASEAEIVASETAEDESGADQAEEGEVADGSPGIEEVSAEVAPSFGEAASEEVVGSEPAQDEAED